MSRVTPADSFPATEWLDDHWYPVRLKTLTLQPKGRNITFGGRSSTARYVTAEITWLLLPDVEADIWVRDYVDLNLRDWEGRPPKCKLLICTLAGKDPRRELTPWIDDETLEFGFTESGPPAGRITPGLELLVKGIVKESTGQNGGRFLRVERYQMTTPTNSTAGPVPTTVTVPATAPATPAPTRLRSADGHYEWTGTEWVAVST